MPPQTRRAERDARMTSHLERIFRVNARARLIAPESRKRAACAEYIAANRVTHQSDIATKGENGEKLDDDVKTRVDERGAALHCAFCVEPLRATTARKSFELVNPWVRCVYCATVMHARCSKVSKAIEPSEAYACAKCDDGANARKRLRFDA